MTTLNDPVLFEAAQALARRILQDAGPDPSARAIYGFRRCLTRRPDSQELDRLLAYYRQQLQHYQNDLKAAAEVAKGYTGPSPNLPELAAWTMVSNVLLNLDETITKD